MRYMSGYDIHMIGNINDEVIVIHKYTRLEFISINLL